MKRGTIVLFIFIIIVAAVIGVSQFLQRQPPVKITVAVDPLVADWIEDAVTRFNENKSLVNGTRRVEAEVTVISEMDVWRGNAGWNQNNHPDAWIPSSSVSVSYAQNASVPVQIVDASLAKTLLVWGGYASRVDALTRNGAVPLDWETVAAAAQAESWAALGVGESGWQFFKLAFALPDRTMNGLAVLYSGAAYFNDGTNLTGGATSGNALYNWLEPIVDSVPSFQTLGGDVASAVARGPSTVEIALLPENQWLDNLDAMLKKETVRLSYPSYQFVFDVPLARWDDAATTDTQRGAVQAFGDFLLTAAEQTHAVESGLRPVQGEPPATAAIFADAEQYGIQLNPDYGQIVEPPTRTEAQTLIQWFINYQRR